MRRGYHSANASPENIPAPIVIVMVRWSLDLSYEVYQNPVAIWKNSNYLPHSVFLEAPALHARCVNYPTVVPSPWSAGRHMVPEHLIILLSRKITHHPQVCSKSFVWLLPAQTSPYFQKENTNHCTCRRLHGPRFPPGTHSPAKPILPTLNLQDRGQRDTEPLQPIYSESIVPNSPQQPKTFTAMKSSSFTSNDTITIQHLD